MAIGFPAYHIDKRKHLTTQDIARKVAEEVLIEMNCMHFGYHQEALDYKTIGSSALSLGERILVFTGPTEILLKSECLNPAQFLDFGKNKRNSTTFYAMFEERVANLKPE